MVVGVNWFVSGVPQGSVLGPLLFHLYTSELFSILENKLFGYADDSNLMAVVHQVRDLGRVSEWCDLLGMKFNEGNTMTMIVSRSRTMHPQSPSLGLLTITPVTSTNFAS